MTIEVEKGQITHVEGVIKRQNGTVRMIIKESQQNGVSLSVEVRYLDEAGNDVTNEPWLAYADAPEVAEKMKPEHLRAPVSPPHEGPTSEWGEMHYHVPRYIN